MKRFTLAFTALLLAVASVVSISTASVYAADESSSGAGCDEQFYAANDILFYNPCATTCSAGNGVSSAATIPKVRGKNNAEKIFNFWIDAGMSAQQAAGISGSMKHEGGFSPFRQEMSQSWPGGGWGIAQFTHDPGQRGTAKKYVSDAIGADLFNQYYKAEYGGGVVESNGFVPQGVPVEVNDKFLLAQLNYLLTYIKDFKPSSISARVNGIKNDYGQDVPNGATLFDYLHSLVQAPDAAIAWTYLYEYPGDIKATAQVRANSAADILELYANGISSSCGGGLVAGGMDLEQAKKFMEEYKNNPSNEQYIGGAGRDCAGGPLSNCVSFSTYFINKYTNIKGFDTGAPGNGSTVAANIISRNPDIGNGHSPRPYAIFSTPSGSQMCGNVKCGHTGVILGVDTANGKVIVGEAGCGGPASWDTAREYPLSQFDSDNYTYAYTDSLLKGDVK
ncbi:MAG: phage tail tip lysozyme [Candidatus Microsaccharimonas sp.]